MEFIKEHKDEIQCLALTCTSLFTLGVFLISCVRAWIEWKTYITEWWKVFKK